MVILLALLGKSHYRNITTSAFPFKPFEIIPAPVRCGGLFVLTLFWFSTSHAGFERTPQPPAVYGDGMSSVFSGDIDQVFLNPSAAASLKSLYTSFFYSPSPFDLPQLSNGGMIAAFPLDSFTAALAMTRMGFSLYREMTVSAVAASTFGGIVSAGCSINYDHLAIARYGSAYTVGIDAAAAVLLSDDIRWGFSFLNLNRPTIGGEKDQVPQLFLTGVNCDVLSTASVSFTLIKDVRYPVSIRTGIRFAPLESIVLRAGVSSDPSRYYAGFGIRYSSISVDYSVATHAELGLTHTIGISFSQ
jgi:hypothetical protein